MNLRRPFLGRTAAPLFFLLGTVAFDSRAASLPPAPTAGHHVDINVGRVGVFDRNGSDWRYGLEFRFAPVTRWQVAPAIGGTTTEHDASYAYLGLRRDFSLDERWLLTPSFDTGLFNESRKLDLGSEIEFRSGLALTYRLENRYRLSLALYHLSNGGIGNRNPGTESITLSVAIPLN